MPRNHTFTCFSYVCTIEGIGYVLMTTYGPQRLLVHAKDEKLYLIETVVNKMYYSFLRVKW